MSTLSLRIPESLHNKLREISKKESVSINQFISSAVAEKMSALMTEECLLKKANSGSKEAFLSAMIQPRIKRMNSKPALNFPQQRDQQKDQSRMVLT